MELSIDQVREIGELLDKRAITELLYTYCRAVDQHDFKLLRTLYSEDAVDDHGPLLYKGSAAGYIAWLETAMEQVFTSHAVQNHLVSIEGDTAEGEAYVTAHNQIPNGAGGFDDFVQGLRYLDKYRKTNGRWQFTSRTLLVDWAQLQPAPQSFPNPLFEGKSPGTGAASDPSYQVLSHPLFARR